MKRDMELVRKILLKVESIDNITSYERLEFDGYSGQQVWHNVRLLLDQGYLRERGGVSFSQDGVSATGGAMTFEGHDFLAAARNDNVWRKAMDKIGSAVGSASFAVVKGVLESYAKQQLGVP